MNLSIRWESRRCFQTWEIKIIYCPFSESYWRVFETKTSKLNHKKGWGGERRVLEAKDSTQKRSKSNWQDKDEGEIPEGQTFRRTKQRMSSSSERNENFNTDISKQNNNRSYR